MRVIAVDLCAWNYDWLIELLWNIEFTDQNPFWHLLRHCNFIKIIWHYFRLGYLIVDQLWEFELSVFLGAVYFMRLLIVIHFYLAVVEFKQTLTYGIYH